MTKDLGNGHFLTLPSLSISICRISSDGRPAKVWTFRIARKPGVCAATGQGFAKGDEVFGPVSNGFDRMLRIRAEVIDQANEEAKK